MATIKASGSLSDTRDGDPEEPAPLTPEQVLAIKAANPSTSPWWVVAAQAVVGALFSVAVWLVFDDRVAISAVWGVMAVVLPSALFARGLTSQFAKARVGAAVTSFFVWELVKVFMTVGLLFAAHRWVSDLSWPAMLAALVVTLKVYWIALAFKRQAQPVCLDNAPQGKATDLRVTDGY